MNRVTMLWAAAVLLSLSGCIAPRIQWPWSPIKPYNAGYHSGCEAKRKGGPYRSGNDILAAPYQAEYALGFSDGYALCEYGQTDPTPSPASVTPQNDKHLTKEQKDCKEKRRLCFR